MFENTGAMTSSSSLALSVNMPLSMVAVELLLTGLRQDLYLPPLPFLRQEGAAVSATLFTLPPFSKSPVIVTTPDCSFGDALDTEDFLELRAHRQV
jgi:hypothetical protein